MSQVDGQQRDRFQYHYAPSGAHGLGDIDLGAHDLGAHDLGALGLT